MTVSMIDRHKVDDFATWKKGYDGTGQLRKNGGVIASSVHRALDDPNTVTVIHQFADESAARAFRARLDSDEFRAMAKETGIKPETLEAWLLKDVE